MNGDVALALWALTAPAQFVVGVAVGIGRLVFGDPDLQPSRFATGGVITPPAGTPSDRTPALLSPGRPPPQGPWKAFGVSRPIPEPISQPYAPYGTPEGASPSRRQAPGNGPQVVQDVTEAVPEGPGHPRRTGDGYSGTQNRPDKETQ